MKHRERGGCLEILVPVGWEESKYFELLLLGRELQSASAQPRELGSAALVLHPGGWPGAMWSMNTFLPGMFSMPLNLTHALLCCALALVPMTIGTRKPFSYTSAMLERREAGSGAAAHGCGVWTLVYIKSCGFGDGPCSGVFLQYLQDDPGGPLTWLP